ncbi:flagellar hook-length control protein FliK [Clostridium tyrobutyricum]|uniref:flagellar hook-length control protein FliK n=1 Tax=Clostridium tyrobutyricum TaxID=1519 RepID=UPI001FAA4294|nr:flagellar hook-length control protein FliK [Clostridium tyrobutyricum]
MDVNVVSVKVENPYLNSSKSNTANTSSVNDDSFSKMIKKSVNTTSNKSDDNNKAKIDTSKQNNEDIKSDTLNYIDKVDSQKIDSKIESYLKKAGFTDEDIKNIKEKIDKDQISESRVYDMLSLLFGDNTEIKIQSNDFVNKFSQELSSKILNNSFNGDISSIKDIVNKFVDTKLNFLKDVLDTSSHGNQVLEKISQNIAAQLSKSQIADNKNIVGETDLKTQIYMELVDKLNLKTNLQKADSKIESYLKEAGFTDEEVKNIGEKIDKNQISESSIYNILSLLLGDNTDIKIQSNIFLNELSQELSSKILNNSFNGDISSIKDIVNKFVDTKLNFLKDVLDTSSHGNQVLEKISQNIAAQLFQSHIVDSKNVVGETALKTQIYMELVDKLNLKTNLQKADSKIESYLKEAGFTDEEIKNIGEKIDKDQISESSVYDMLSLIFGDNTEITIQSNDFLNELSQELSSKILNNSFSGDTSSIKDIINTVVDTKLNFLKDVLDTSNQGKQVLEKISEKVSANIMAHLSQSQAAGNKNIIGETDLKTQIYMELINKLNLKLQNTSINNSETQNNSTSNNNSNKDADVLNKILNSGDSNNKIDKTVNFMTQFNNINNKNTISTENPLENLNINKSSFTEDIIKSIKYMETNNVKDMTVKISPKELGNITINLVMEEGKMKAVITASNKDAYNILNSNIQDLSNKFQNSEIKIQNFSLNLYHEDTTFFKEEGKNRQNQGNSKQNRTLNMDSISSEDKILQQDDYSENNVDMLA